VANRREKGLLIVLTGDGKGKTSAALGLALRAAGRGMRTHIIQFIKAPGCSGEHGAVEKLAPLVSLLAGGTGFVLPNDELGKQRARQAAQSAWAEAGRYLGEGGADILVLDELPAAVSAGLLDAVTVLTAIRDRRPELHVIVTGRDAPEELCRQADVVTEMVARKHPYEEGRPAELGIDF
jgi:cob(I)alamin adenosyltransferase